ncbi:MAG: Jag N-terminal domain-containing protein [Butyricicoccus pullicaecorum]|nr:Jag N-terminal domain-containing protein [Butyricicoccus pullicaecorum]
MQKEQIFCAQTVDRAIEKALESLHLERDAISVEVVDMGRKGFLGIGASDAKIRVTYETQEEPVCESEEKDNTAEKPAEEKRDDTPRLVKAAPPSEKPAEKPKKAKEEAPRLVRAASGEKLEKPKTSEAEEKPLPKAQPKPESEWSDEAKRAVAFIDGLLVKLGIEGHAFVTDQSEDDHIRIEIEGSDMGPVIGRRGDTLDAIQYLTSLVLNRGTEDHIRLTIDTENYRIKRAESLERLARKMAGKVIRYHKPMTLEPMNPYERRIIHAALQDYRGVTTHSTGTEPGRRVVISPEGSRKYNGRRGQKQ